MQSGSHRFPPNSFVSDVVRTRWIGVHGKVVGSWLEQLPTIIEMWAVEWGLALQEPLSGGSSSAVLAVDIGGEPAVLKLAAPWSRWSRAEAEVLAVWNGVCSPRLLESSADGRAILIERILPGNPPDSLDARSVADLIGRLPQPIEALSPAVPCLREAVNVRFDRARENRHDLMDLCRLRRARASALELATEPLHKPSLLHGDLLRKNILCGADEGMFAIDPNPAVGDPCYDAAQWAITEGVIDQAQNRCKEVGACLGLSGERIWAWAKILATVEVSLASEARARETLALLTDASPPWW